MGERVRVRALVQRRWISNRGEDRETREESEDMWYPRLNANRACVPQADTVNRQGETASQNGPCVA